MGTAEHYTQVIYLVDHQTFRLFATNLPHVQSTTWSFDVIVQCGEVSFLHNAYVCTIYTEIYEMNYGRNIMIVNEA